MRSILLRGRWLVLMIASFATAASAAAYEPRRPVELSALVGYGAADPVHLGLELRGGYTFSFGL